MLDPRVIGSAGTPLLARVNLPAARGLDRLRHGSVPCEVASLYGHPAARMAAVGAVRLINGKDRSQLALRERPGSRQLP